MVKYDTQYVQKEMHKKHQKQIKEVKDSIKKHGNLFDSNDAKSIYIQNDMNNTNSTHQEAMIKYNKMINQLGLATEYMINKIMEDQEINKEAATAIIYQNKDKLYDEFREADSAEYNVDESRMITMGPKL